MILARFETDSDSPVLGAGAKHVMYVNHFVLLICYFFLSLTSRVSFFLDIR